MQMQIVVSDINKLFTNRNNCSGFFILKLANSYFMLIELKTLQSYQIIIIISL